MGLINYLGRFSGPGRTPGLAQPIHTAARTRKGGAARTGARDTEEHLPFLFRASWTLKAESLQHL